MTKLVATKVKENRLYFSDKSDKLENIDGRVGGTLVPVSVVNLRKKLEPYILGGIIGKIDSYVLNNARIVFIKFNLDISEERLKKLCVIVFGCIPLDTVKLTYKGINGAEYSFLNPLEVEKNNNALAMLDALEETI